MSWGKAMVLSGVLVSVGASTAAPDKKTERTWKAKCASCHGVDGKADTQEGKKGNVSDMTTSAWQKAHPDDEIAKVIKEGTPKTDKHGSMDGYALEAEEMTKMVVLIRSFAK